MTRHPSSDDWSEDTRPDIVKPFPSSRMKTAPASDAPTARAPSEAPLSGDRDHTQGVLMAALAKIERANGETARRMGLLEREVGQLRRDIEKDREELVSGASKKAAAHSSNRLAGIMTGLFAAWEILGPYVHELIKVLHQ